jgi:NADH-quinone oxidoreductase subunit J
MSAEFIVFNLLSAITIVAAACVVLLRNPIHSAVAMVVTFLHIAAIFIMLRAEFLAVVQIIVYTGAILVLVVFVLMLVNPDDLPEFHGGRPVQRLFGFILGAILLAEVAIAIVTRSAPGQEGPWNEATVAAAGGNVQALGQVLYSDYVLPIQVTALVLLMATIGALFLARPDEDEEPGAVRRSVYSISLAHPRGPEALPPPHQMQATTTKPEAGDRDLIMTSSADDYTDWPPPPGYDDDEEESR